MSSEADQRDTRNAKHYLDQFGTYKTDYFVARGNHDRVHNTTDSKACSTSTLHGGYHDCFHDTFAPDDKTFFARQRFGLRIIGIDTYDTTGNGGDEGAMGAGQMAFVQHELARDRDRPTIVFGHHPVAIEMAEIRQARRLEAAPDQARLGDRIRHIVATGRGRRAQGAEILRRPPRRLRHRAQ